MDHPALELNVELPASSAAFTPEQKEYLAGFMAGIAQSSPMVSTAISWNASTNPLTFSRSIRPSVCEMSVMASS